MLTNTRSLRTTQYEPIYENDNFGCFRFLIPPKFYGYDMTKFYVLLKYIAPDNQIEYTNVSYERFQYEGMLSITVPITRRFTYKRGVLKLQLIFMSEDGNGPGFNCDCPNWTEILDELEGQIGSSESGEATYRDIAFSTAYAFIDINRSNEYSCVNPVQKLMYKVNNLEQRTVDNIKTYPDSMEMQLQSHGKPIGDRVEVPCKAGEEDDNNEWIEIGKYYHVDNSSEWDRI